MWYYRLSVAQVPGKQRTALVLDRMIPDLDALSMPAFDEPSARCSPTTSRRSRSRISAATAARRIDSAPTWRDTWDDAQLLPMLVRIEVTPRTGEPWPPIVVAPRTAPEAGCRAWDTIRVQCVGA